MKQKNLFAILTLALAMACWGPGALLAGEHGGQEHGGAAMEGSHEEGSHADHKKGSATTIREAASLLKTSHPELAAKLEKIAAEEEKE